MSERIPVHLVMVPQQSRNALRAIPDHESVVSTRNWNVRLSDDQLSIPRAVSVVVRNRFPVLSHLENLYSNARVVLPFAGESFIPSLIGANRQVPDHSPLKVGLLAVHHKFFPPLDGRILAYRNVSGK